MRLIVSFPNGMQKWARPAIFILTLLFALLPLLARDKARPHVCCKFETDRKPMWAITLDVPISDTYRACEWHADLTDVVFASDSVAVALVHQDCYGNTGEIPPIPLHTMDTLLAIDTQTGRILRQLSWKDISIEPRHSRTEILRLKDSRILFLAGLTLKLCSTDLTELASRTLEPTNPQVERWSARASADGTIVLLRHWNGEKDEPVWTEDHWISAETLKDIRVDRPAPYDAEFQISNTQVFYNLTKNGQADDQVYVRQDGNKTGDLLCDGCMGVPVAVTASGIVILDHAGGADLWLVASDGTITFRNKFGQTVDHIGHVVVTPQGTQFAFSFGHARDSLFGDRFDRGIDTVVVFDSEQKKERFRLKAKTFPRTEPGWEFLPTPTIGFSPQGKQLLVLDDFVLKCFAVRPRDDRRFGLDFTSATTTRRGSPASITGVLLGSELRFVGVEMGIAYVRLALAS